jgi:CRP-like cAMP-binding protein
MLTLHTFKVVTVLGEGDCFGELALINNRRRAARVSSMDQCLLGVLKKGDYKTTIGLSIKQKIQDKQAFLKNFRLFKNVLNSHLYKLSYSMILKSFQRGQHIYREGDTSVKGLYFVKSGEFEVT